MVYKKKIIIDTSFSEKIKVFIDEANRNNNFEISAITTVFGYESAYNIANKIKDVYGVKVVNGAEKALMSDTEIEYDYEKIPKATQILEKVISESNDKVEIVTLGPLTNIAIFILSNPKLIDRIGKIHIVGGAYLEGDKTPASETSFLLDPEAAKIVISSGLPIRLYGCDKSLLTEEVIQKLKDGSTSEEINDDNIYGKLVLTSIKNESNFRYTSCYVDVDLEGEYTRGALVVDYLSTLRKDANVEIFDGLIVDGRDK